MVLVLAAGSAAAADAPSAPSPARLQFADALTGRAVQPEVVLHASEGQVPRGTSPSAGAYEISATAAGYAPVDMPLVVDADAPRRIRVLLDPLARPPELAPDRIEALRRPDATLFLGYVVDDDTGEGMEGVSVQTAPSGNATSTDAGGFFQLHVPFDAGAGTAASLSFTKPGWRSEVRHHLELWPGGDWTYRVRLTRGEGAAVVDERETRRRAPEGGATRSVWPARAGSDTLAEPAPAAGPPPTATRGPKDTTPANSTLRVPRNIRVLLSDNVTVEYTSLETYCTRVLPAEWIASWAANPGGSNSLNAGAVAVRTYAIGYIHSPRGGNHDICATTACQVYGSSTSTYSDTAVAFTTGVVMVNSANDIPRGLTEYSAENNQLGAGCGDGFTAPTGGCLYDPVCAGEATYGHGRGLCQWGSARWATGYRFAGRSNADKSSNGFPQRDWTWILTHYYPALRLVKGTPLVIGDNVTPRTTGLNVRLCPGGTITNGTSCPAVTTKSPGAAGLILDGPVRVTADGGGYTWYRVQWGDTNGWSVENYLDRVFPLPAAPANLVAAAAATNRINLLWSDSSDVEAGFEIERAPAAGGPWLSLGTVAANVTAFANTNLFPGSTWSYRVRAVNAGGPSAYSPVASATTPGVAPTLAAISNYTVVEGTLLGFPASASAADFTRLLTDFEPFQSETANGVVLFRAPRNSASTSAFLGVAPDLAAVADVFPANPAGGGRVLRVSFNVTNASGAWVRLTTAGAASFPNPVVDLTKRLRVDVWCDRPLRVALGCRETATAAGTPVGADGGTAGAIEWVGVTNVVSGQPQPTRTVAASTWTTLVFDLPVEAVRSFSGGNGVLSTASGLGVLEQLALVPAGGAGVYKLFLDNLAVLEPKALAFSLDPGAPYNATLGAASGLFAWTPTEAQGPGAYAITARVTDNSLPPLSAAQLFNVTVLESNRPPVLAAIPNRTVHAGTVVTSTNAATDPDLPPNALRFSLYPGSPPEATVDAVTGFFTWPTSEADVGTPRPITVRVTDDGTPPLASGKTFTVLVVARPALTAGRSSGAVSLSWPAIAGTRYRVQFKDNLAAPGWTDLATVTATGTPALFTEAPVAVRRFYRVVVD